MNNFPNDKLSVNTRKEMLMLLERNLKATDSLHRLLSPTRDLQKMTESLRRSLLPAMHPYMGLPDNFSKSLILSPNLQKQIEDMRKITSSTISQDFQKIVNEFLSTQKKKSLQVWGNAPVYIPSHRLGSEQFHNSDERYDDDLLLIVRKSGLHPDVLQYCEMELSGGDYFPCHSRGN